MSKVIKMNRDKYMPSKLKEEKAQRFFLEFYF